MTSSDTIYALSSAYGVAAISIVRITGLNAKSVAEDMASKSILPRQAIFGYLKSIDGDLLDQAIILYFPKGNSFTGEDIIEFQIHGSLAVLSAILKDLAQRGLRAAEPGEFTRRAFLNNRLNLVEVEGLSDLLQSKTQAQRKQALRQLDGFNSSVFEGWRLKLMRLLAYAEASIDFSDEDDVNERAIKHLTKEIHDLIAIIESALNQNNIGERIRNGFQIVLAGAPNAGKSTIFNKLLKREAAIVSNIPGTTRDILEADFDIDGIPITIADTAGIRMNSSDPLELEGIRRSKNKQKESDLLLWVASKDAFLIPDDFDSDALWIWNKTDESLPPVDGRQWIEVSAKNNVGLTSIMDQIKSHLLAKLKSTDEFPLITRDRHRQCIIETLSYLKNAIIYDFVSNPELFSESLRLSVRALGRLVGVVDVEDLLDIIFRDFCIGK